MALSGKISCDIYKVYAILGDGEILCGALNNDGRLARNSLSLVERLFYLVEIMSVDIDNVPTERLKLLVDGIRGHNVRNLAVYLQTVVFVHFGQSPEILPRKTANT